MVLLWLVLWLGTTHAQSLPRWPSNTQIKIVATSDRERVQQATEAWRPWLPQGMTMELAETGNVTILREKVPHEGQCALTVVNGVIVSAVIRIDPSLKGEDFELAVEHELGHVLGLQHRANSIMGVPYVRTVKVAGLITVARIVWRPNAGDKNELEKLYANQIEASVHTTTTGVSESSPRVSEEVPRREGSGIDTSAIAAIEVPVESSSTPRRLDSDNVNRYAFHRSIKQGNKCRESDFVWSDSGKLIEINIKGNSFKNIPQFEIAENPQPPQGWGASWTDESGWGTLTNDAKWFRKDAKKSGLMFPAEADRGAVHIKFSNYREFTADKPIITPIE